MSYYEEVELDDMEYDEEEQAYFYPCPCGDKFFITVEDLQDGEEIGTCPSCSLEIRVLYNPDDFAWSDGEDAEVGDGSDDNGTEIAEAGLVVDAAETSADGKEVEKDASEGFKEGVEETGHGALLESSLVPGKEDDKGEAIDSAYSSSALNTALRQGEVEGEEERLLEERLLEDRLLDETVKASVDEVEGSLAVGLARGAVVT